jgi:hypothetical protein
MAPIRGYQPSFTAGELSPALWARVDLAKYATGLKTALNMFIHAHGGASNRAGLEFVRDVKDSADVTRLIPFQFNTEQSYILEFGDLYFRVFRDGGVILSGGSPYEVVTPYTSAQVEELTFIQEADVMYICHTSHAPRKLSRIADANWTLTTPTFAPSIAAPTGISAVRTVGAAGSNVSYKVAAIADSGEESLPSATATVSCDLSIAGNKNTVSWTAPAGAVRYIVYKLDNGVYGYIGGTEGLSFVDENIVADLADVPQKGINPFNGAGKYPRVATFVDQRLAFASSSDEPQAVWLSQSANYENFGRASPAKESDAITFRIRSKQVNEVRGLIPFKGLMILTSGGEFIASGADTEYLTQAVRVVPQGYRGCSVVQPIVVGNTVLFAQERGGVVRDFSYEFAQDSFVGKDLTILARHLFEGKEIKAWAYAQAPYSIVWVVLDDGSLVSMTYLKEHDVWGWTRHETDGVFEDVAVIAEGKEDMPYFIVKRTVGGVDKRYIERLHTREFDTIEDAFFVDSGLSYSGTPISVITLEHLKGKEIVALVDGNVVTGLTADASTGQVTLPNAGSVIHAGLGYTSKMQTLDLDMGSVPGMGSVQARWKTVTEATMRVEKTRGIWTGPTEDNLVEYKQRAGEAWNEAIGAFTGDISITPNWDWTKGGTTWVCQFDPLPMTILAIAPDVVVGR